MLGDPTQREALPNQAHAIKLTEVTKSEKLHGARALLKKESAVKKEQLLYVDNTVTS